MREDRQVPLAPLTTMRVGGPASRLVTAESADELIETVRAAGQRVLVLSGGSNLLISDEGFDGTVARVASRGIDVDSADRCGGVIVTVAAGESWDGFVTRAVEAGWAGVEALSGIPGLVGATPIQNVGAYGQEVAQTIASVRVWDRRLQEVRTFDNADCGFTYRQSLFKTEPRYVVLDVVFRLSVSTHSGPIHYAGLALALGVGPGERVPLADAREAVLAQRRQRGMVLDPSDHDTWSCGSFFTNPVMSAGAYAELQRRALSLLRDAGGPGGIVDVPRFDAPRGQVKTSAAWLIDHAGFGRGYGMPGPAALSTKHVLALTNRGSATAAQVVALAREIRDGVHDAFGVSLVNEPVLVGTSL